MTQTVLFWYIYYRPEADANPVLWEQGSDPLQPADSPARKLKEIITRVTQIEDITLEDITPNHWDWYSDDGPSPQWAVFGHTEMV